MSKNAMAICFGRSADTLCRDRLWRGKLSLHRPGFAYFCGGTATFQPSAREHESCPQGVKATSSGVVLTLLRRLILETA